MYFYKKNNKGLTLLEVIISIAIIGIISTVTIPLFTMAIKSNSMSKSRLESTYTGMEAMELAYHLSKKIDFNDLEKELTENYDYTKDSLNNRYIYKYDDKNYVDIKFIEEGNLISVIVNVYENEKSIKKYETLYSWIGRGILDE